MKSKRVFLTVLVFCMLLAGNVVFAVEKSGNAFLLERAKNLYGVGDYVRALTLFRKAVLNEPNNGEALDFAGWCSRYLGDWGSAERTFMEAKPLLPGYNGRWVLAGLGETYLGAALFQKSADAFQEAIDLAPEDEELVIRCLKGLALAYASLGDEANMLSSIQKLGNKNKEEAGQLLADAKVLLAEAEKIKQSEDTQPPKVSNAEERQASHILAEEGEKEDSVGSKENTAQKSRSVPDEKTSEFTSQEHVRIWGFPLGERMETVVSEAHERGISLMKFDEPTEFGQWIHAFDYPGKSPLPDFATQKADFVGYALDEFDSALIEVRAIVTWKKIGNSVITKNNMFEGLSSVLVRNYGEAAFSEDRGIFSEAFWIASSRHAVALYACAGLDGTVRLELSYLDIPLYQKYWEHIESQGKDL
ncbi:MAG: hypothetical protein EOM12_06855 [Verrucomicrobiae bacterium]|nr:hypothetical protein [Verrucomicrobiae bacterium]